MTIEAHRWKYNDGRGSERRRIFLFNYPGLDVDKNTLLIDMVSDGSDLEDPFWVMQDRVNEYAIEKIKNNMKVGEFYTIWGTFFAGNYLGEENPSSGWLETARDIIDRYNSQGGKHKVSWKDFDLMWSSPQD